MNLRNKIRMIKFKIKKEIKNYLGLQQLEDNILALASRVINLETRLYELNKDKKTATKVTTRRVKGKQNND